MFSSIQTIGGFNSSRNHHAFSFLHMNTLLTFLCFLLIATSGHAQGTGSHNITVDLQAQAPVGSYVEIDRDDNWLRATSLHATLSTDWQNLDIVVQGTHALSDQNPSTATIWIKRPDGTVHEGYFLRVGGTLVEINNIDL